MIAFILCMEDGHAWKMAVTGFNVPPGALHSRKSVCVWGGGGGGGGGGTP